MYVFRAGIDGRVVDKHICMPPFTLDGPEEITDGFVIGKIWRGRESLGSWVYFVHLVLDL